MPIPNDVTIPSRILFNSMDVFADYFNRKSILALATQLTQDIIKSQGYRPNEVAFLRDAVYLAIIMEQGSIYTSGSAYCVTTLLECLRFSEDNAYWAGFLVGTAVSLAMDFSPWGVLSTTISTIAGFVGKRCALLAYEDCKESIFTCIASNKQKNNC